jgi:hypothetical protein
MPPLSRCCRKAAADAAGKGDSMAQQGRHNKEREGGQAYGLCSGSNGNRMRRGALGWQGDTLYQIKVAAHVQGWCTPMHMVLLCILSGLVGSGWRGPAGCQLARMPHMSPQAHTHTPAAPDVTPPPPPPPHPPQPILPT